MNKIIITAAILNLITALIHTVVGHFELIVPFVQSDFPPLLKAILHACWHMVTTILFISSLVLLYIGARPTISARIPVVNLLGSLYIAFSIVFMVVGLSYSLFLFQVVLLLPIGIMSIYGARRIRPDAAEDPDRVSLKQTA